MEWVTFERACLAYRITKADARALSHVLKSICCARYRAMVVSFLRLRDAGCPKSTIQLAYTEAEPGRSHVLGGLSNGANVDIRRLGRSPLDSSRFVARAPFGRGGRGCRRQHRGRRNRTRSAEPSTLREIAVQCFRGLPRKIADIGGGKGDGARGLALRKRQPSRVAPRSGVSMNVQGV